MTSLSVRSRLVNHPPQTVLQKLGQRASCAFASFTDGVEDTTAKIPNNPNNPDELEVLGGRKTVVCSASRRFRSGDDRDNSPNQIGAAEMLVDYYEGLENPGFQILTDQDYAAERFTAYPSAPSVNLVNGVPGVSGPGPFQSSANLVMSPAVPDNTLGQVFSIEGLGETNAKAYDHWQTPLANSHHIPSQQTPLGMPYVNLVEPIGSNNFVFASAQNQNEIWRNFVADLGGPA